MERQRLTTAMGILLALSVGLNIAQGNRVDGLKSERVRLMGNLEAAYEACDTLRDARGRAMADCRRQAARAEELEGLYADARRRISEMGIRAKYAQSIGTMATETVVLTDTVYVGHGGGMKVIAYQDAWTQIRCEVGDSTGIVAYSGRDTISQVVYRVPKRWWFFRWGTKAIRQRVRCSNPRTAIVYNEYIEISKR